MPQSSSEPRTPAEARRGVIRILLFLLLPVVLVFAAYRYVTGGASMTTDDAYVDAGKVEVSTDIAGVVSEIDVHENQHVEAGQVLYKLRELPYRIAYNRLNAAVGIVRLQLEAQKANYGDIQAQIKQAQDDIDYYDREFKRQQFLSGQHVASESALDAARRAVQAARQKLVSLNQQLAGVAADLGGDPNTPVEQHPRYLEAIAERDEAARQLSHTVVTAPFAGIVTNVPAIAPGKYLAASATAFFLIDTDHVWVDAEPKETQLTYVLPGQRVTVTADTYPDAQWRGTVESVSPAASQEFSLLPAQNTSGNWVKVVQRIPLRIAVDTSDRKLPVLRPGMSVEIAVDTGHARGLPRFLGGLFGGRK